MECLDRYDTLKLDKAKVILLEILEFNYKPHSRLTKRLETILSKIDELQELFGEDLKI